MVRTSGFSAGGGSASGGHPSTFMYNLYILQSLKDLGYYIGITDDVDKRIKEHNQGKTKSIKNRIPFVLKYLEKYNIKTEARKREILLKKNYQIRKELLSKLDFNIK